jgi:hypothetical protein
LQHGIVEADLRLGDFHAYGLDQRMILQYSRCNSLGDRFDQIIGRSFDDGTHLSVHLAVVDGSGKVISLACRLKVAFQCEIDDEPLP